MQTSTPADPDFRAQARVLKALANEARLKLIDRLHRGDCSAGDLTKLVGLDQSTVSRHLGVLRSVGIVDSKRAGSSVIYSLLTPCVVRFFLCARQVIEERSQPQSIDPIPNP